MSRIARSGQGVLERFPGREPVLKAFGLVLVAAQRDTDSLANRFFVFDDGRAHFHPWGLRPPDPLTRSLARRFPPSLFELRRGRLPARSVSASAKATARPRRSAFGAKAGAWLARSTTLTPSSDNGRAVA